MSETGNAHASVPSTNAGIRSDDRVDFIRGEGGTVVVRVSGLWHMRHGMPLAASVEPVLTTGATPRRVAIDATGVTGWDSSLVNFIVGLSAICGSHDIAFDSSGLPPGLSRLIELAETVPENKGASAADARGSFVVRVGSAFIGYIDSAAKFVDFVGMVALALVTFLRGRSRYRRSDLIEVIQACGASALGIVSLISYLVGVILAYMGAVELQQFGASIYVADLVGIGMVREMGAMMTAIIMAGRTGAAFAAQLGSMKVTQEIDALSTMGISPMEFLVVPRIIALVLMMPLLCLYSDFVGILGGATVGVSVLGLSASAYWHQSLYAITMTPLVGGLIKSVVYGVLIALAGCYQGFECGNSSSAVGEAATSAVVSAIVMIVVACGMFAVLFNILGI
jgi:phospholipid/cholesterol/gamma-HCH transport system permease protein